MSPLPHLPLRGPNPEGLFHGKRSNTAIVMLLEHADFEQAILAAAGNFGSRRLRPALIETDYSVTEALQLFAAHGGDKVIFKGGTSLWKGWNLFERFSEGIDIFSDLAAFKPRLSKDAIVRELKRLRDEAWSRPALTFQ